MITNIRCAILTVSIVLGYVFVSVNSVNALERKHIFNLSNTADSWNYRFINNLNIEIILDNKLFLIGNNLNISQYLGAVKSSDTKDEKTSGKDDKTSGSNKNEIIIAMIGFLGILATATLSNWDKVFSNKNGKVLVPYSGYRATGIFETELRYFFEVSGTRKNLSEMQKQVMNNFRINLKSKNSEDPEKIDKYVDGCIEDAVSFEEILNKIVPVYQNHFNIDELQELNKFYSTESMQDMNKKMPAILFEIAPIMVEIQEENIRKILANYDEIFSDDDD